MEKKMDIKDIIEFYSKLAIPGQKHKFLSEMAGNWDTLSKAYIDNNNEPIISKGSSERRMLLDGRFLYEEFSGEMFGKPFKGIGITGFNNHTKKYAMALIESMSTGVYHFEGKASKDSKTILLDGKFKDPLRGTVKYQMKNKIVDNDTQVFEVIETDKNGMERKTEVTYKRRFAENILSITKIFDAPRSAVFKAWANCDYLIHWWGPKGYTMPFCKNDFRTDGIFHYCMRSSDGRDYFGKSVYREIIEQQRIVYTDFFVDENGNPVSASYYGMDPKWPKETTVTVIFEDYLGKTKMTLQHALSLVPDSERQMCRQGWEESFDKLEEQLSKSFVF